MASRIVGFFVRSFTNFRYVYLLLQIHEVWAPTITNYFIWFT
jgi:hypothetical protein